MIRTDRGRKEILKDRQGDDTSESLDWQRLFLEYNVLRALP